MKIRNIITCLIIPISIVINNSYTMENNNDDDFLEDIFNEMKNGLEICSLEDQIQEKNKYIHKTLIRTSFNFQKQISAEHRLYPMVFANNILKPLLNDENIVSELSSIDLQSKGYATKTYQYMININKNYEVIAKNNNFIEQLQYILIAKNELIGLEKKLDNLKKKADDLKKKLYS